VGEAVLVQPAGMPCADDHAGDRIEPAADPLAGDQNVDVGNRLDLGFDLKDAYRSGWAVVAVSLIATVLSWIVGLKLI